MVEQYSKVLYPPASLLEKLESLTTPAGRAHLLASARERGIWDAYQRERDSKREKERDAEALAFAEIDWHDFAIVQTIEFTQADALSELPAPMTVSDVETMTLTQKRMAAMITENMEPEVEAHKASLDAADAASKAAQHALNNAIASAQDEMGIDVDGEDDEDAKAKDAEQKKQEEALAKARDLQARSTELGEPIKIRKDYVPKRECCLIRQAKFANVLLLRV
jgi:splicing factor 3A subunit 1